jgi:hypothetical protein
LGLSTNGFVSGTPTTNGTFTVIMLVTDANSLTAIRSLAITINPPLSLASPIEFPIGQFQFMANGATGQNYGVQYSLNFTDWTTFFVTNPAVTPFLVRDPAATNRYRFYRLMILSP